jgi:hypothetical protein
VPPGGGAVASAPVDPDRTPEPDLVAIAADLAAVETALDQLEDGTYVGAEPASPEVAPGTEPDPA